MVIAISPLSNRSGCNAARHWRTFTRGVAKGADRFPYVSGSGRDLEEHPDHRLDPRRTCALAEYHTANPRSVVPDDGRPPEVTGSPEGHGIAGSATELRQAECEDRLAVGQERHSTRQDTRHDAWQRNDTPASACR